MSTMTGKIVLVTGGSTGIGRATAIAFAREGARVVIASRTKETADEAVGLITAAGGEASWIQTDVSQHDQVRALIQKIIATYGRLDCAFNNAGSGGRGGWLAEAEEEDWDKTIDGYLKSVWLCMKYELIEMLKVGTGAIVNNSSVDGQRAFPWNPIYSAAKHGVIGLTKSAAMQYADRGIRINAVCPGWIRTEDLDQAIQKEPEMEGRMLLHQPIGRLGKPEEVAEAVLWLCSDKASLIVGVAMPVDGGYLVV